VVVVVGVAAGVVVVVGVVVVAELVFVEKVLPEYEVVDEEIQVLDLLSGLGVDVDLLKYFFFLVVEAVLALVDEVLIEVLEKQLDLFDIGLV
jgi:hypothetical protein